MGGNGNNVYQGKIHLGMIKRLIILIATPILILLPGSALGNPDALIKFIGKNIAVSLEVAITAAEKEKGLMNRPSLPNNRGMVFIFRPPRQVTFWMKDTLIPLDMIFINKGKIVKIAKNAEPNQTTTLYSSGKEVTEVVEVNGGFSDKYNIMTGDRVIFKNIPKINTNNQVAMNTKQH